MSRRIALSAAVVVAVAGIAIAVWAFPTRYGCDDGYGHPAPSTEVARDLCASPDSPLLLGADHRAGPRIVVLAIAVVATSVLVRLGSEDD